MGFLDSNKFLLGSKKVEVTNKSVNANGYISEGLTDVRSFNTAIIYISGTFAEGVSMNVKIRGSVKNSGNDAFDINSINIINNAISNRITAGGSYIIDISKVVRFGLLSTVAGTYNAEIYLCSKEFSELDINIAKSLSAIEDGSPAPEVSDVKDVPSSTGTIFEFTQIQRGVKYKTLCITVALSDNATGTLIRITYRSDTSPNYEEDLKIRDIKGNIYNIITNSGVYYVDITGLERVRIRQEGSNLSTGKLFYKLVSYDAPDDLKPIQLLGKGTAVTLTQNQRSCSQAISMPYMPIYSFKYLRVNVKYTGNNPPSGNIYIRVFGGSGKEVLLEEFDGKEYFTKWHENFLNPDAAVMYFTVKFADDFSPAANDTIQLGLYGIR